MKEYIEFNDKNDTIFDKSLIQGIQVDYDKLTIKVLTALGTLYLLYDNERSLVYDFTRIKGGLKHEQA